MKKIQVLALGSVLFCLALAGIAMASEAEVYTVGDFAVNLAKMVTNKADYTVEDASVLVEKLGVDLGDLSAEVDEELFVQALTRFGVNLTTSNPDRAMTDQNADRVFKMFDRNDSLFAGELFSLCKGGAANQNSPCVTNADCIGGFCQVLSSIKCVGGSNDGTGCMGDGDSPGGYCKIPDGQAKKLGIASPSD